MSTMRKTLKERFEEKYMPVPRRRGLGVELALKYNISTSSIYTILSHKNWSHI